MGESGESDLLKLGETGESSLLELGELGLELGELFWRQESYLPRWHHPPVRSHHLLEKPARFDRLGDQWHGLLDYKEKPARFDRIEDQWHGLLD